MGQIARLGNRNGKLETVDIDLARFELVYEQLVVETENRRTLQNRLKNQRLQDALALMEFLRGEEDDNPLDRWFGDI